MTANNLMKKSMENERLHIGLVKLPDCGGTMSKKGVRWVLEMHLLN